MADNNSRAVATQLQEKWAPILDHADAGEIKDTYKKAVTAVLLENQEQYLKEAVPTNFQGGTPTSLSGSESGGIKGFDPVLISLVRRSMPQLIAYDVCGVQPMSGPTGLIFAMRSRYMSQTGNEAMFNEADTDFSGRQPLSTGEAGPTGLVHSQGGTQDAGGDTAAASGTSHTGGVVHQGLDPLSGSGTYGHGSGMFTQEAERLGGTS